MRKKQLFAVLLAGSLSVGMAPVAAFAAEDNGAATEAVAEDPAGEETAQTDTGEAGTEGDASQGDTQAADDAAAAADTEAGDAQAADATADTQTADATADTQDTAAQEVQTEEIPAAETTEEVEPQAAETTQDDTGIQSNIVTTFEELKAAIANAPESADVKNDEPTGIVISGSFDISETLVIPANKSIAVFGQDSSASLGRAEGMTGDLFLVQGALYMAQKDGSASTEAGTLTVDGSMDSGASADGSIVKVEAAGRFTLTDSVTLSNNISSGQGAAIQNEGEVYISGGTVTGCRSDKGAIYSTGVLAIKGNPQITGNTKADGTTAANILLGENGIINVAGHIDESAHVSVSVETPAVDRQVVAASVGAEGELASALSVIKYEGISDFALDNTGKLISTLPTPTPTSTVTPTPTNTATPTPTTTAKPNKKPTATPKPTATTKPTKKPTATPKPTRKPTATPKPTTKPTATPAAPTATPAQSQISVKWTGFSWSSHTSASVTLLADMNGSYYYAWTKRDAGTPTIDTSGEGTPFTKDKAFTIYLNDLTTDESEIDLYIRLKDSNGNLSGIKRLKLSNDSRPAADTTPTVTPSRDPLTPAVTESRISGLEEALEFYPGTFYDFTVVGAGTDNQDPVEGDVKWVPLYWSTAANPADNQKHSSWKIGSTSGITKADTYNLYIFFQKWIYTGGQWQATDNIESATYQFESADITVTPSVTGTANGTGGTGESGTDGQTGTSGTDASTTSNNGSSSGTTGRTAVSTADESPVGTMSALAVASLLAGGYVIIRRRKKDI